MKNLQEAVQVKAPTFFSNIQGLRAIAALMVMLFHMAPIETKYFGSHWIPEYFAHYGMAGVDLFFVISGFVMVRAAADRYGSLAAAIEFIARRAVRIYPVYWVYTTIMLIVLLASPTMVNSMSLAHEDVLASFTLLPTHGARLLPQAWTLTYELYFYVVFTCLIALCSARTLPVALLAWSCIILLAREIPGVSTSLWLGLLTDPMVLEFIAGALAAVAISAVGRNIGWVILAGGTAGFAIQFFFGAALSESQVAAWRSALFGLPSLLWVLGAALIEKHSAVRAPRWLCVIGDASYTLYLTHIVVASIVARLLVRILGFGHISLVGTLLCTISVVCIATMAYRLIEYPLHRLSRRTFAKIRTSPVAG